MADKQEASNNTVKKPQVILRISDENGIHLIKKWGNGTMSLEGHTSEKSVNHNINTPSYFFSVDEEFVKEEFRKEGKEYRNGY